MMIANNAKLHQEGYEFGLRFANGEVELHKTVRAAEFARRNCGSVDAEVVFRPVYVTDWVRADALN